MVSTLKTSSFSDFRCKIFRKVNFSKDPYRLRLPPLKSQSKEQDINTINFRYNVPSIYEPLDEMKRFFRFSYLNVFHIDIRYPRYHRTLDNELLLEDPCRFYIES